MYLVRTEMTDEEAMGIHTLPELIDLHSLMVLLSNRAH